MKPRSRRATRILFSGLLPASICLSVWAQSPPVKAPIASNPIVEIQGKIVAVKLIPGQGMPTIEVDNMGPRAIKVWLGSMRYLMEQKFSPKVGESVQVKGYSIKNENQEEEIVAISVKLPASNQVLLLRDDSGYPVWGAGMGPCWQRQQTGGQYTGPCHHPCNHR